LNANAAFFESDRAPKFVLFKLQPLDHRFSSLDDGQALFSLLKWYYPKATEKKYLLLQRVEPSVWNDASSERMLLQRTFALGEEVRIDYTQSRFQKLEIHITESIPGRIRRLLYHPELMTLQVRTVSGKIIPFDFIPSMARQGFLFNPLLLGTSDLVRLYGSRDRNRISAFRIIPDGRDLWYQDRIHLVLRELSNPTSTTIDSQLVERLATSLLRGRTVKIRD
jgi:hypothetical protein